MPWCCYVDGDGHCANTAEFHIETSRPHGGPGGPDPYADETDACVAHVGPLLGWQPDAQDTEEIAWRVSQVGRRSHCPYAAPRRAAPTPPRSAGHRHGGATVMALRLCDETRAESEDSHSG